MTKQRKNNAGGTRLQYNTPLKIKRTGKMIEIESKNALRKLKFDTEIAKT